MILHFSHIGLTDGLTFMIPFGSRVPAARLWLPLRQPLPTEDAPSSAVHGADLFGRMDAELLLLEVDEATVRRVVPEMQPDVFVVTNIFRDQLDRYFEPAYIRALLDRAMRSMPAATVLILNADDPRTAYLGADLPNPRLYFGMSDVTPGRGGADPGGCQRRPVKNSPNAIQPNARVSSPHVGKRRRNAMQIIESPIASSTPRFR